MQDLYSDPRFWALKPSQGRALPILTGLMAQHGQAGILNWTRKELQTATRLSPRLYADLLQTLDRHGWACETDEGWLVLCAPLAPAAPLPGSAGPDLHAIVSTTVAAAIPAAIRQYEADRKRRTRSGAEMSGTTDLDVPDNSSHARAPESNSISNRFEEEITISIDSNRSHQHTVTPSAPTTPEPRPKLILVPADVEQEIARHGISRQRAQSLVAEHGLERCATVLASLPHWKYKNAAAAIQSALANPDKWPIPAQIAQQKLPLLTNQPGGAAPRSAPAPSRTPEKSAAQQARERLTEPERLRLRHQALDRLVPIVRAEYDKATSLGQTPGPLLTGSIQSTEDEILLQRLRQPQRASGAG